MTEPTNTMMPSLFCGLHRFATEAAAAHMLPPAVTH